MFEVLSFLCFNGAIQNKEEYCLLCSDYYDFA